MLSDHFLVILAKSYHTYSLKYGLFLTKCTHVNRQPLYCGEGTGPPRKSIIVQQRPN